MTLELAQPAPARAACPLAELCPVAEICPTCWENCEECGPPVGPLLAAPEPDPEETDADAR